MITQRGQQPRGLHSSKEEYGFFVRVSGENRRLLKTAQAIARGHLEDTPSNPLLLHEMMRVYVGHKGIYMEPQQDEDDDFESDI